MFLINLVLKMFYFHSTDKQNNLLEFPYDLYNAKKLVIYSVVVQKHFTLPPILVKLNPSNTNINQK